MTDRVIDVMAAQAIQRLVDYLEFDEQKDYECRPEDERSMHIYTAIKTVREWLNGVVCADLREPLRLAP